MSKRGAYIGGSTVISRRDTSWFAKDKKGRRNEPGQKTKVKRIGLAQVALQVAATGKSRLITAEEKQNKRKAKRFTPRKRKTLPGIIHEPSLPHTEKNSTIQTVKGKRQRVVLVEKVRRPRKSMDKPQRI
jgi:hypothetical protein